MGSGVTLRGVTPDPHRQRLAASADDGAGEHAAAATSEPGSGAAARVTQQRATRGAAWLGIGAAAVLAGFLFSFFVAGVVSVHGHSMEPTLHNGERALVLRTGTWLHRLGIGSYQPGDIVFFPDPADPARGLGGLLGQHLLIKRIVAGPGTTVSLQAGALYVDGRPRREPYLAGAFHGLSSTRTFRVPSGDVFVMGDNRRPLASFDSRSFGPVPQSSIEGRAVLVVWPLVRRTARGWRWNVRLLTGPGPEPARGPVPSRPAGAH